MNKKEEAYLQSVLSTAILSNKKATNILVREGYDSLYDVMKRLKRQ